MGGSIQWPRLSAAIVSALIVYQAGAIAPASSFAAPAALQVASDAAEPAPLQPSEPGEQPQLRTQTSKTILGTDGRYVTTVAASPLHFPDEAGRWEVIDSGIVASDKAGYAWQNAANGFQAHFRRDLVGGFVTIESEGRRASLSLIGAAGKRGTSDGEVIAYRSILAGVDIDYAMTADGVKETLVLRDANAPSSFRFLMTVPKGGLVPELLGDGSWALWAPDLDEPLFVLTRPFAEDADGDGMDGQSENAKIEITEVAGQLAIDLSVDPEWLSAPGRAFPVRLDPTLVIGPPTSNLSFRSSCGGCSPTAGGRRNVGGNSTTAWVQTLRFNIGDIPAGATITSAELGVYFDRVCISSGCGGTSHLLNVHRMTSDWDYANSTYSTLTWAGTPLAGYTLPAPGSGETAPPAQWMTWGVTTTVNDWFLGTQPNHGFMVRRSPQALNTNGPSTQGNTSTDDSIEPRLIVTWSGDGLVLAEPNLLHATGAELHWSKYVGPTFTGYEVHRSATANFTPSAATRLTTIRADNATAYTDTTARAGGTFSYAVVVNGSASNQRRVTLPAAGTATVTLQPDPTDGKVARIQNINVTCQNAGNQPISRLGPTIDGIRRGLFEFSLRDIPASATVSAAAFSYYYEPTTAVVGQVKVHRASRAWREGAGGTSCDASGASWQDPYGTSAWTTAGGDYNATASATLTTSDRTGGGWDTFDVTSLVSSWVNGSQPNHGMLVRASSETLGAGKDFAFYTDDFDVAPTLRPKLLVTYSETLPDAAPRVSISKPGSAAQVSGAAVAIAATAHDDGAVASVEFFVDGAPLSTDTTAPYEATWNTGSLNGNHTLSARATDDAGNQTTSAAITVSVYNKAAPTILLAAPANPVSGTLTVGADAAAAGGVDRVEFFFDDYLIDADTSVANGDDYSISWDTLDPLLTAYDGTYALTARVYDSGGQVTTSAAQSVTVANRPTGSIYKATIEFLPGAAPPGFMYEDQLAGGRTPDPTKAGGGNLPNGSIIRTLAAQPYDSTPGSGTAPAGACTTDPLNQADGAGYSATVRVTNTSTLAWTAQDDLRVWYRWYRPVQSVDGATPTPNTLRGEVIFEGEAGDVPGTIQAGGQKSIPLTILTPKLCGDTQLAEYQLRVDLYRPDTDGNGPITATWFSQKGNQPAEQRTNLGKALAVDRELSSALGLERYFHYWAEDVGAGMTQLVNVANGNTLLHWSPWAEPGRGLSSVLSLTYNSLEDRSHSPIGNSWSLALSSLTRFGEPLDLHAVNGQGNRWIEFTDGDGTTHRFEGKTAGQVTYWEEPPGVHLYLRAYTGADAGPTRTWAITRPDRVTFFFDVEGFPTFVRDRNGNELQFVLETTPAGEDPGGPTKRVTEVRDNYRNGVLAGDSKKFTITYYTKAEAKKPQVRGKIRSISDHNGSALRFDYYEDGNLLRITQAGGTNADGSFLPDRSFVFTYTTSSGAAPAIPAVGDRIAPVAKTPNQSTRIYSIRDPRSQGDVNKLETILTYYGPGSSQLRWRLKDRDDRTAKRTSFAYNLGAQTTTLTAPLSRVSTFTYDDDGKVTAILDPASRTTTLQWSADFAVTELNEPGTGLQRFTYNDNGYLTSRKVKISGTDASPVFAETALDYTNIAADANDVTGKWRAGRTIPHISQLFHKTDPKGVATPTPTDDFRWTFGYDTDGNLTSTADPEDFATTYLYDATTKLLTRRTDARGDITLYEQYDRNGLATRVKEGLTSPTGTPLRTTTSNFDDDGNLIWLQDGRHQSPPAGAAPRSYRTFFDYDEFGRPGRQSTPKSTDLAEGLLIWTDIGYDANDNVTRSVGPHFGYGDGNAGAVSLTGYDAMDRATLITGPDQSVDPAGERVALAYDDAGRLTSQVRPNGVLSPLADDYTTTFAYDPLDRVIRQTAKDLSGAGAVLQTRTTHFCFDTEGNLASLTGPRAQASTVNCASPPAFTATYGYDHAHRQTSVTDPKGRVSTTVYDVNSNVSSTQRNVGTLAIPLLRSTTLSYDQRNLLTTVEEPLGAANHAAAITTLVEYDPVGNRSRLISPRAFDAGSGGVYTEYVAAFEYDALDRLTRTTLPDDANTTQAYLHTAYDAVDNPVWTSLPTATATAANVSATDKTQLTFFDPGWIATSDNPDILPAVHFDYTAEGWQRSRAPERAGQPDRIDTTEQMVWEYYPDGLLRAVHDRGGHRATYAYDADNQLTLAKDASGGSNATDQPPISTTAVYNDFDEPTLVYHSLPLTTNLRTTRSTYFEDGSLQQRKDNGVETAAPAFAIVTAPTIHTFTYDDAGWLETDTDDAGTSTAADDRKVVNSYLESGWPQTREVRRNNGSGTYDLKQKTTWDYFDNGKLKTLTTINGATPATTIESHTVSYLNSAAGYLNDYVNGHRTSDSFTRKGPSATCGSTACPATYTYDARDRLVSENNGHGATNTYGLDVAGNLTTQTIAGATTTNVYVGNQLQTSTRAGALTKYFYTATGALDCITNASGVQDNCKQLSTGTGNTNLVADYTYDYLDRLESTRTFTAANALDDGADYVYDALDRVVSEKQLHGATVGRTETFGFLGLSNLVTSETQTPTSGSATTKTYAYDAWGQRTTMTSKLGSGTTNWYAYGSDAHGSVSTLLNITSTNQPSAAATYGYSAYGAADDDLTAGDYDPSDPIGPGEINNNNPLNAYRYTAKRLDTGAGDGLDMGARRYSPDAARFLQLDYFNGALADLALSSDPLTSNRYGLAGGNPLSFIESDGHMAVEASANAGGGLIEDYVPKKEASDYVTAGGDPADLDPLKAAGDATGVGGVVDWAAGNAIGAGCLVVDPCRAEMSRQTAAGIADWVAHPSEFFFDMAHFIGDARGAALSDKLSDKVKFALDFATLEVGAFAAARAAPLRGLAAEETVSTSSYIETSLARLTAGRSPGVRLTNSAEELNNLFADWSRGGTALESTYPGALVRLPDGTIVGWRGTSASGGPAIDVNLPAGDIFKVHVE
ncbi:MAG: DNRLRE domain-containing protein [Chloroflexota bacterium]